jgi:hypothetical protein
MLTGMGVQATADEVVTSAQAACHVLAETLPAGAKVLVVGTTGLIEAARERGFTLVESADDEPAAVVQGYGPERGLAAAGRGHGRGPPRRLVRRHQPGRDRAVEPRAAARQRRAGRTSVAQTTGVTPTAVGKPDTALHRESVQRSGATHPIVVGDRLDTDIEGASRAGCDSMLVLTVSPRRPTCSAPDRGSARPMSRRRYAGCSTRSRCRAGTVTAGSAAAGGQRPTLR